MNKALFLDRDGIINLDHGYVYRPDDFEFVDGIFELCQRFKDAGYMMVVVTNQAGIARGYYSEQDLAQLNAWMTAQFAARGVEISAIYYCPHHPTAGIGDYLKQCSCRKPEPGMMLDAAQELDINLKKSLLIGDKLSDVKAGQNAGLGRTVLVKSKYTEGKTIDSQQEMVESLADINP